MTWVLTLHLLSAVPSLSTGAPGARLLAQTEAPLPPRVDPAMAPPDAVAASLASLNARIRAVNVNWPTGAVVAAYLGGIVLYVAVLSALVLIPLASLTATPLLIMLGVGIAGAGLLIGGLVAGSNAAAAARMERDELIREREKLERLGLPPPPGVERWTPATPTVTLVRF